MAKSSKEKQSKTLISTPSSTPKYYKKIIGLDLSLTGTGWAVDTKEQGYKFGVITTKDMEGIERLNYILQQIQDCPVNGEIEVEGLTDGGKFVVIEDFSFGSKGSSIFQIAGLGYLVRYMLWRNEINFILVPPPSLKKFATGAGNTDKNIVLKEIYKRWKVDINDDNAGDAFVLSRIGRVIVGWDSMDNLTLAQKEVIGHIKKLNNL